MTRPVTWKPAQHGLIEAVEKAAFEYYWNTPDILETRDQIERGFIIESDERERLMGSYRQVVQAYARGRLMLDLAYNQEQYFKASPVVPHENDSEQRVMLLDFHGQTVKRRAREARCDLRVLNRWLSHLATCTADFWDRFSPYESNDTRSGALLSKPDSPQPDAFQERTYTVEEIGAMLGKRRD